MRIGVALHGHPYPNSTRSTAEPGVPALGMFKFQHFFRDSLFLLIIILNWIFWLSIKNDLRNLSSFVARFVSPQIY
jgi:hypothetical protein